MQSAKINNMFIEIEKANFSQNRQVEDGTFNIPYNITKKINIGKKDTHLLELTFDVKSTEKQPFPINLEIVLHAYFNITGATEKEIKEFLGLQAVQLAFPYLRSAVASITSGLMVPTINIPLINPKDIP